MNNEQLGRKIDSFISVVSPTWAARRAQSREIYSAYEAAEIGRLRRDDRSIGSADYQVERGGRTMRELARHLDENHDITSGALTSLVNNIIGRAGISIEPTPRLLDGSIADEFAGQIIDMEREANKRVDVAGQFDRGQSERMMCLCFLRDGEIFQRNLCGFVPGLKHNSKLPYSIELIDADWLDLSFYDEPRRIRQSIEFDQWGRPLNYWFYKYDPNSIRVLSRDRLAYDANFIDHLKMIRRPNQARGVTVLASGMNRIRDLKDYEESERISARIAAAMTGYIKKGSSDNYHPNKKDTKVPRDFQISPGMIFDNLAVGEDIGTINHNRPSPLLQSFRDSMIRAFAAGVGGSASTIGRVYDKGSYSSQRQENIEAFLNYSVVTSGFISTITMPSYQRRVTLGVGAGLLNPPVNLDWSTLLDAEYRGPVMPLIDPVHEANADLIQVQAGFKAISQAIRDRGRNPREVFSQIRNERENFANWKIQLPNIAEFSDPDAASTNISEV